MNPSAPFVRRPVASCLVSLGLIAIGLAAWRQLPVASLPSVDLPTIRVSASRPGADAETMAASVAAPLERRLGAISGVTEITSTSGLGQTSITVQFDQRRKIDRAAQDVQSAINAAATDLPSDLPSLPSYRKANPAGAPIMVLALTSPTIPTSDIYDVADTVLVQRLSQVQGVADVSVSGAEQPAIRIEVDPLALAAAGVTIEDIRAAIVAANAIGPLGAIDGPRQSEIIKLNAQIADPNGYRALTLRAPNGTVIRLTDIARVSLGARNSRAAGAYDGKPAVLLTIARAQNANVVETVARLQAVLPELRRYMPDDIKVEIMSDRTVTLRASLAEMQRTLTLSILCVMGVVFLFLMRGVPTLAAAITIPLSFAGTFVGMWFAGVTINNISLMALAVSVGFVVDDAIVVTESIVRRMERGAAPLEAAIDGTGAIVFTVIAISLSLIAAFTPLFFMDGVAGRFMREFATTVAVAIAVSTIAALTITPALCGRWLRPARKDSLAARIQGRAGRTIDRIADSDARSLDWVLRRSWILMVAMIATVGWSVHLFQTMPKGYFPPDDTGLLFGWTGASPDASFEAARAAHDQAAAIIAADPAVAHVGSFVGASSWVSSPNSGRLFVALKPLAERRQSAQRVAARLRGRIERVPGVSAAVWPVQDVRAGSRQGKSEQQLTLFSTDLEALRQWAPVVAERLKTIPGIVDVSHDNEDNGLVVSVAIDRDAAARAGVTVAGINAALNNAFSQRQIVTIYGERNQYRVVIGAGGREFSDPESIDRLFVAGPGGLASRMGQRFGRHFRGCFRLLHRRNRHRHRH